MWFIILVAIGAIIFFIVLNSASDLHGEPQYQTYCEILEALKEEGFKVEEPPEYKSNSYSSTVEKDGQVVGKLYVSVNTTPGDIAGNARPAASIRLGDIVDDLISVADCHGRKLCYISVLPENITTPVEAYNLFHGKPLDAWMTNSNDAESIVLPIMRRNS